MTATQLTETTTRRRKLGGHGYAQFDTRDEAFAFIEKVQMKGGIATLRITRTAGHVGNPYNAETGEYTPCDRRLYMVDYFESTDGLVFRGWLGLSDETLVQFIGVPFLRENGRLPLLLIQYRTLGSDKIQTVSFQGMQDAFECGKFQVLKPWSQDRYQASLAGIDDIDTLPVTDHDE